MTVQSTIDVTATDYYSCDLTRILPVRISIVTLNGPVGFGVIESLEGGHQAIEEYVTRLAASESIVRVDVTHRSEHFYWTRVVHDLKRKSIHDTILDSGCMSRFPIVIQNGVQRHQVLAPSRKELKQLIDLLRNRFDKIAVKQVLSVSKLGTSSILTEKQREALELAYREGYYTLPRGITIEEMASKLSIRRVALRERLRRAENRLVASFMLHDSFPDDLY